MKYAEDTVNLKLKAGQPDYFGVSSNTTSLAVRNSAVKWLGSRAYRIDAQVATNAENNPKTSGSAKCNLFVTHIANSVGATTPYWIRWNLKIAAPIARDDWFTDPGLNVQLDRSGWIFKGVSDSPHPGMAVASPRTSAGPLHGHVGVLDYDGSWINAGSNTVNKSVHLTDESPNYKPNNFRSR